MSEPTHHPDLEVDRFSLSYTAMVWGIALLFLVYTAGMLQHAGFLLNYPWSIDYVEWPEIARAWDLNQGRTLYPEWDALPLREANYTPIYTIINALGVSFTGPTPFFGRLLALCSTLGIMATLATMVYPRKRNMLAISLLAAGIYASSHMVWLWSAIVRVDNMAVFFSLTGVLFYSHRHRRGYYAYIGIGLCILSAFTRQTMVAAAAAILVHSLYENRSMGRRLFIYYALSGVLGLGILLVLSKGRAWAHLITANMNAVDWAILPYYLEDIWLLYHWLVPSVLLGTWVLRRETPLLLYGCFATVVSLTIVKVGSSLNYLLEWWAAVSIFAAAGLVFPLCVAGWKRYLSAIVLVFSFLAGWQNILHVPWQKINVEGFGLRSMPVGSWTGLVEVTTALPFYRLNPFGREPMTAVTENLDLYINAPAQWEADQMLYIEDGLRGIEGPILSEDMNFTLGAGKDIALQPFEFAQMAEQGVWDPAPLNDCLVSGCFGALVLMFDLESQTVPYASLLRFHSETLNEMRKHYAYSTRVGPYRIYLPK